MHVVRSFCTVTRRVDSEAQRRFSLAACLPRSWPWVILSSLEEETVWWTSNRSLWAVLCSARTSASMPAVPGILGESLRKVQPTFRHTVCILHVAPMHVAARARVTLLAVKFNQALFSCQHCGPDSNVVAVLSSTISTMYQLLIFLSLLRRCFWLPWGATSPRATWAIICSVCSWRLTILRINYLVELNDVCLKVACL